MEKEIKSVAYKILKNLDSLKETPSGKANLSKIRNSIGKPLSETIEIWPYIFEYLPEDFLGSRNKESYEELAIISTLQLYSIHQQGSCDSVIYYIDQSEEKKYRNIGSSFREIRDPKDKTSNTAIDRRFNIMITSDTFEELIHHLRHFIKILKSNSKRIKIDYSGLCLDLFYFLLGREEQIRLSWAREYYKNTNENKGE